MLEFFLSTSLPPPPPILQQNYYQQVNIRMHSCSLCKLIRLQVDCQNLLSTDLLQVVSTSCNKSANDKLQQAWIQLVKSTSFFATSGCFSCASALSVFGSKVILVKFPTFFFLRLFRWSLPICHPTAGGVIRIWIIPSRQFLYLV